MPGLEPGIQAAASVIILRTSALDTRVKPAYDEAAAVAVADRVGSARVDIRKTRRSTTAALSEPLLPLLQREWLLFCERWHFAPHHELCLGWANAAIAIRSDLSGSGNTDQQSSPECRAKNKGQHPDSERAGANALQFGIPGLFSRQALDVTSGIHCCGEDICTVDRQRSLISPNKAQTARCPDFRQFGDLCPGVERDECHTSLFPPLNSSHCEYPLAISVRSGAGGVLTIHLTNKCDCRRTRREKCRNYLRYIIG